jgi:hypothetical protein
MLFTIARMIESGASGLRIVEPAACGGAALCYLLKPQSLSLTHLPSASSALPHGS